MSFIHRYEIDRSAPTRGEFWHDLGRRAALPGLAVLAALIAVGFLITGPLEGLPGEAGINEALVRGRTDFLDRATFLVSLVGNTEFVIGLSALIIGLIWWRTREWWYALVPAIAIALQAVIFMASAAVVGRERPDVEPLDHVPPTSSFPSGHTGAAAAMYLTLALMAQRIPNPAVRWFVTVLCVLMPFAMGYARMYRGLHSLSDVVFGFINGAICAYLAWNYLRRETA